MASIQKRGKTWQARMFYTDGNGKRRSISKSGFKTKSEAKVYISQLTIDKNNNKLISKEPPIFYEYFWKWFETYKANTVSEVTAKQYIHTRNVLKEYFGNTRINKINREIYQKFLDDFGKDHAKETVKKVNNLVHGSVRDAIYDDYIKKDFVSRTHIVYNKDKAWKVEYLSIAEIKQLTNYLLKTRNKNSITKYMILIAIYTGMRIGEIQGLQWEYVNLNFKTIQVQKTWDDVLKKFKPTKTESSKRIININDTVVTLLKELREINTDKMVFVSRNGTIPTSTAANKALRDAMKQLNIVKSNFHFHSIRHAHVAYLLANNIDIYIISKRLGHKNITTTINKYSYLIDEYQNKSNEQIENALNKIDDINKDKQIQKATS